MRYIGNKEKLLEHIYKIVIDLGINSGSFFDFFSGTGNVGKYFKTKGFEVYSGDILYLSYVLQKAYIENNTEPKLKGISTIIESYGSGMFDTPLSKTMDYLNRIDPVEGFIYNNYTSEGTKGNEFVRNYFQGNNGKKIDAIRQCIESWNKKKLITKNEYFILLGVLIESVPYYANISGVYAAFLKIDDPRSLKEFKLRDINLLTESKGKHKVHYGDSMKLLKKIDVDVLYLDPPYNARQYAPNYHLLETIAKYDDPQIKGVTGMRDYSSQKSDFCNKDKALLALDEIASKAKFKYLLLSYNSEGIMPTDSILATLGQHGETNLIEIDYRRFKSNSNGEDKQFVKEQVFVLSK